MKNNQLNDSISCMRILSCEMINKASSGHPGIALGISPLLYTLFKNHIKINPKKEKWYDRDRFILSAGHGSAILYALLHLIGFDISIDQLKEFRQIDSITPGHPEADITPGVETITGPLGQGIGVAVGCALAESIQSSRFNKSNLKLVDHYTYAVTSDGDLQEGSSYEAISLAGHWKLNKLILLFDSNDIQLDSETKLVQSENIKKRFESSNWNYILVKNGNDEKEINKAIIEAKKSKDKPTLIEVKTIIGYGSSKQGTTGVHGAPIFDDINILRKKLNWNEKEFCVPKKIYDDFSTIQKSGESNYNNWFKVLEEYKKTFPNEYKLYINEMNNKFNIKYDDFKNELHNNSEATRVSSGKILSKLSNKYKNLVGGSADLSASTKISGADGIYSYINKSGRNILYGVREFAMATINNGLAIHGGIIPFASGFFVFSDYMKPAMRLCSMMKLQQLYIFTHDSVLVGEDGPTHQPVEQLAMFRAQPNINVFRPSDLKETIASYSYALNMSKKTPSLIALTRQNTQQLENTDFNKSLKGAYIISEELKSNVTLIASGSEVELALQVKKELSKNKIKSNVVSMLCQEIFDNQKDDYKNKILPRNHIKISIELGSTFGWEKYTGNDSLNFGISTFGFSAKSNDIIKKIKFNKENITKKIIEFLSKKKYK